MEKDTKRAESFKMIPGGEEKCVWMAAGVIDFKLCNNYYNCYACAFDKAMKEAADQAKVLSCQRGTGRAAIVDWREKMKQRQGADRKCRHALTGRTGMRVCSYNYECYHCPFDQMLEDGFELQLANRIESLNAIDGYSVPDGHFFHPGHTWARVEYGGRIRIGMDDFSTRVFGKADKFELPLIGEVLNFNEVGLAFGRKGNEAFVLSPVGGIVAAVNCRAAKEPGMIKDEPYDEGWLLAVEPFEMKKDLKKLLYGSQTAEWIRGEHLKLMGLASQVGVTLADGGVIDDVVENLPHLSWKVLTSEFLRT